MATSDGDGTEETTVTSALVCMKTLLILRKYHGLLIVLFPFAHPLPIAQCPSLCPNSRLLFGLLTFTGPN